MTWHFELILLHDQAYFLNISLSRTWSNFPAIYHILATHFVLYKRLYMIMQIIIFQELYVEMRSLFSRSELIFKVMPAYN